MSRGDEARAREVLATDDRAKAHYAWREERASEVPLLAARVFALRGTGYMGCGFHYEKERRLGAILARLNDYDTPLTLSMLVVEPMMWAKLQEDVSEAEATRSVPAASQPTGEMPGREDIARIVNPGRWALIDHWRGRLAERPDLQARIDDNAGPSLRQADAILALLTPAPSATGEAGNE